MAYGTTTGVSDNLVSYNTLISSGDVTADMVTRAITRADAVINMRLTPIVGSENIPLATTPPIVQMISEYLATCYILRRIIINKDPNRSENTIEFCETGMELLNELVGNPEILESISGVVIQAGPDSTTLNDDAIFSVGRTSSGSSVEDGTMDDWNE